MKLFSRSFPDFSSEVEDKISLRIASSQVSIFCHGPSTQEIAKHSGFAVQVEMSSAELNESIKRLRQLVVASFTGFHCWLILINFDLKRLFTALIGCPEQPLIRLLAKNS